MIRWMRSGDQPLETLESDAKPVLIAAGALGAGRPRQDLIVSPQHRILVGSGGQLPTLFDAEAFAPAKSLTSLPGIRHMNDKKQITWVHFACDQHEVVTANGCLSESLLLGPMVVKGLTPGERQTLAGIYAPAPTPDTALNGPPARDCLSVGTARHQIKENSTSKANRLTRETEQENVGLAMVPYEADRLPNPQQSAA